MALPTVTGAEILSLFRSLAKLPFVLKEARISFYDLKLKYNGSCTDNARQVIQNVHESI